MSLLFYGRFVNEYSIEVTQFFGSGNVNYNRDDPADSRRILGDEPNEKFSFLSDTAGRRPILDYRDAVYTGRVDAGFASQYGSQTIIFSDGGFLDNGTALLYSPGGQYVLCFTTGTLIRTARGEVAVEDLIVGDLAVTASGTLRPITWIGNRALDAKGEALPHNEQPIRIRAGAFGPGRPARDLRLSHGHPVLVGADANGEGGVLVPVMCLINGTTITREPVSSVTYWHVELDGHDILLAEGLPAESYIDGGDRAFFAEGSDHALHNPDFVAPGWNGRCRPVAVDGPLVEAERQRLDAVFAGSLNADCSWCADEAFLAA
ncbi:UNVERIFIED_ORG: hypothetical protein J2W74_001960 [Methylorubrum zatmanii]